MPRAKRHFLPGYAWHITHRCHKKEFLLKFAKDRSSWMSWLFEAKKRYRLCILDYTVTSNHIHVLMHGGQNREAIAGSMQLTARGSAQEFNRRKKRWGAFREDRYHATAVETNHHLIDCLTYIDLNMVRAGVVMRPSEWEFGGYAEIQAPRQRYSIIDHRALMGLPAIPSLEALRRSHSFWVEQALARSEQVRESMWTESIAVGSGDFVETIKSKLRIRAKGRKIFNTGAELILRESQSSYNDDFDTKKSLLSRKKEVNNALCSVILDH